MATASPAPYLLETRQHAPVGVVLVHGFLASPAELRDLGEHLHADGVPIYGVRLKGHGTSPWDLREQAFEDWLASTVRGISIMQGLCERVVAVGFSKTAQAPKNA